MVVDATHIVWEMISAYLRGKEENLSSYDTRAPRPTAEQIKRAVVMLELWHKVAIQLEEVLGYDTTIGTDGWPVNDRHPSIFYSIS